MAIGKGGSFGFGDIFEQCVEIAGAFFEVINWRDCLWLFKCSKALAGGFNKSYGDGIADDRGDGGKGIKCFLFVVTVSKQPAHAGI